MLSYQPSALSVPPSVSVPGAKYKIRYLRQTLRLSSTAPSLTILLVGMGMNDPIPKSTYLVEQLIEKHPNLAYIHLIEAQRNDVLSSLETLDESGQAISVSNGLIRGVCFRDRF